jgi:hypothetical protein
MRTRPWGIQHQKPFFAPEHVDSENIKLKIGCHPSLYEKSKNSFFPILATLSIANI